LEDIAKVESMPNMEGKKMIIMLAPKKLGQPKKKESTKDVQKDAPKEIQSDTDLEEASLESEE